MPDHRGRSAFDRVLDEVGAAVVGGELPAGHVVTVESLVDSTVASRSIVREATRVLVNLGLLTATRRVGLRVLPATEWDVLDPLVIGWRLRGPDRDVQLADLRELRRAVEPAAAAAAAASRSPGSDLEDLVTAGAALQDATTRRDAEAFLRSDQELHAAVLRLSGNAMFVRLRAVVSQALAERITPVWDELTPRAHDVELHARLVRAVVDGDATAAARTMHEIVGRTGPH